MASEGGEGVTEEKTLLGDTVERNAQIAAYDKSAKELMAYKKILARIFKRVIEELRDVSIDEVEKAIEGEIWVATKPLYGTEKITPADNDGSIKDEGTVYYDIVTHVLLPNNELTKVIVNVEAQRKDEPGYDLVTRALFYCARLLSQQLGREFTNKTDDTAKYDNIKKVYSIWVCINAEQNQADSIIEYKITPNTLYFGEHKERRSQPKKHRYDIMRAVMIYLSHEWETTDSLLGLLSVLFGGLDKLKRKQLLQEVYELPLTKEIEKGVNDMCNLGEGIYERGIEQGIIQGIERGIEQGIEQEREKRIKNTVIRMLEGNYALEEISKFNDISVEEVIAIRDKAAH